MLDFAMMMLASASTRPLLTVGFANANMKSAQAKNLNANAKSGCWMKSEAKHFGRKHYREQDCTSLVWRKLKQNYY
jgi:hypothetical protein